VVADEQNINEVEDEEARFLHRRDKERVPLRCTPLVDGQQPKCRGCRKEVKDNQMATLVIFVVRGGTISVQKLVSWSLRMYWMVEVLILRIWAEMNRGFVPNAPIICVEMRNRSRASVLSARSPLCV